MTYEHTLHVDIETRSSADIAATGAYKYAQDKDFKILLIAYAFDDDEVYTIDLQSFGTYDNRFFLALKDPAYLKLAYNASFEWYCLNMAGFETPLDQWQCVMAHSLYCGYPAGLEATGKAIGLPHDKQKLMTGKALIRYFCTPAKATKKNGGRPWNEPEHDAEKWELFMEYNRQDVEAEREIERILAPYPLPDDEIELWRQDVRMNARGARLDRKLIEGALYCDAESNAALLKEARDITGLDNPNSPSQLQNWLWDNGCPMDNLQKATVKQVLAEDLEDDVRRVLEIRQQLGKTSVKKYQAASGAMCDDDRMRGLIQYYAANRSGRYGGRIIQPQNLPRNCLGTLDEARKLVRSGNVEAVRMLYGNVSDTLSQLTRTMFIPSDGRKLIIADFSAIEARVIAWLAREKWVNDVFATHGKIYEATAAQMFHVPIETIAKGQENYDLRQKGKVATLALGYQGGVNALITMGALSMGLSEEELPEIVNRWRGANKMITSLWYETEYAAYDVVSSGIPKRIAKDRVQIALEEKDRLRTYMTIRLPSGRKLFYVFPCLLENRFGKEAVHYHEVNGTTKKWEETSTYGGKLVENIVQAIARDCLTESLKRIEARGLDIMFHVHDEVVIDAPADVAVDEICGLMAEPIPWAEGLILKAAGFECDYYKKD